MRRTFETTFGGDVRIGTIFILLNVIVFISTLIFYGTHELPSLANAFTLLLYFFLSIQLHLFLRYERRRPNPFILILAYVLILFYFTRITTLYWHDLASSSGVLERIREPTVEDINHTLAFIFSANLAIFVGLARYSEKYRLDQIIETPASIRNMEKNVSVFLLLLLASSFYTLFSDSGGGSDSRLLGIVQYLISEHHLFVIGLLILFLPATPSAKNNKCEGRNWTLLLIGLLVLLVVLKTLSGSRSAILLSVQIVFFCLLAAGKPSISRRSAAVLSAMAFISIPTFAIATYLRIVQAGAIKLEFYGNLLPILGSAVDLVRSDLTDMIGLYVPAFDRAAFLDFSVDLIKNSEAYAPVVSITHMFKSTVDAVTPGFDVFDFPLSANAISFIYYGIPSQMSRIDRDFYQSDQFNVYGEYFVIFGGWLSLPIFALVAYIFQKVYSKIKGDTLFQLIVWRFFVLSTFMLWLTSFGTDWIIVATVQNFCIFWIWVYLIKKRYLLS
ncbi:MAG: hypothetical protein M0P95_04080 [Sulfuritalea sp.]|jgi:hypothetical protein|nr:hypothetical protein [Sulfuritalea sp.]